MNYCIIQKKIFNIDIDMKLKTSIVDLKPFISYSLYFHLNDVYSQLYTLNENHIETITNETIHKIINPHDIIYSSTLSVDKVNAPTEENIFFELLELFQLFNIADILNSKIQITQISPNHTSINSALNIMRECNEYDVLCEDFDYDRLYNLFITNKFDKKIDLLVCEMKQCDYNDTSKYIRNLLLIFIIITKYQAQQGICIIKIENVFYKPIIDIIYLLSSFYDSVILVKPVISNITKGERYIICKTFKYSVINSTKLSSNIDVKILPFINEPCICSIINNDIPYYMLTKLEESNAIIGQQQLESYDQIINVFKNKNWEEKIENLKRHYLQKYTNWCEKNQFLHKTFFDADNLF